MQGEQFFTALGPASGAGEGGGGAREGPPWVTGGPASRAGADLHHLPGGAGHAPAVVRLGRGLLCHAADPGHRQRREWSLRALGPRQGQPAHLVPSGAGQPGEPQGPHIPVPVQSPRVGGQWGPTVPGEGSSDQLCPAAPGGVASPGRGAGSSVLQEMGATQHPARLGLTPAFPAPRPSGGSGCCFGRGGAKVPAWPTGHPPCGGPVGPWEGRLPHAPPPRSLLGTST